MSYILSYGVSIPLFQIERNILHPKFGKKGKHAISYVDEDSITLAFDAAEKCLLNFHTQIDAIFFATTTPVFKNRYHASFIANLLRLPENILALDFCTTSRSATDALFFAHQMIEIGKYKNILIITSDTYFPSIGQELVSPFGHAAVALLLSKEKGLAEIKYAHSSSSSVAEEFYYKEKNIQWDTRFSRSVGFQHSVQSALQQCEVSSSEVKGVILNSLYAKLAAGLFKKKGFDIEKQLIQDTLQLFIGNTRSCHALLLLIHAFESNTDSILLMDYANGTNTFVVTQNAIIENKILLQQLENKILINTYQDYLVLRKAGKWESENYQSVEMFSSEMMQEREKGTILYLNGIQCSNCKTIYYLSSARCKKCKKNDFNKVQLSKTGTVYAFTQEHYFPSSFPPITMVVIDLDGGGRMTLQQTDDMYPTDNKLQIGTRVELVLRKMMENGTKPEYFWKCKLM